MSSPNLPQPPKVSYAKARLKSKNKNQAESQQKIQFQGESSTDIFAHLNQDNLNYIKKELKNKRSSHHHEKGKSGSSQEIVQVKKQQIKSEQNEKTLKQKKVYEKYKNADQVTQRDSRQQQTLRQTQIDEQESSLFSKSIQQSEQQHYQKQKKNILGLQPPPLTYTKYKDIQQSLQSQMQKNGQAQTQSLGKRLRSSKNNNFLEYELRSQTSNNQMGNSAISMDNRFSQGHSMTLKSSQFIDHIQSYIQKLSSTPQAIVNSKSKKSQQNQSDNFQQHKINIKNFKKQKDNFFQLKQQVYERPVTSQRSDDTYSYNRFSSNKGETFRFKDNGECQKQTFRMEKNGAIYLKRNEKQNNQFRQAKQKYVDEMESQIGSFEETKKQLEKERFYCIKLALELEKYKQNQQKNKKQISLLNKTINLLKSQVESVKSLYEEEVQQTQKILTFIQNQKRTQQFVTKISNDPYESSPSSPEAHSRNRSKLDFQLNYKQQKHERKKSLQKHTDPANQFQKFMKFDFSQQIYNKVDPRLFNHLRQQFEKGRQGYNKQNNRYPLQQKNRLADLLKQNQRKTETNINQQFLGDNIFRHSFNTQSKQNLSLNEQNDDLMSHIYKQSNVLKHSSRKYVELNEQQRAKAYLLNLKKENQKKYHSFLNHDNQIYDHRQHTSLQKLKKEYLNFKAQMQAENPNHKKLKSDSLNREISPKQFSHIYVK